MNFVFSVSGLSTLSKTVKNNAKDSRLNQGGACSRYNCVPRNTALPSWLQSHRLLRIFTGVTARRNCFGRTLRISEPPLKVDSNLIEHAIEFR
jgi:hypothetical protein